MVQLLTLGMEANYPTLDLNTLIFQKAWPLYFHANCLTRLFENVFFQCALIKLFKHTISRYRCQIFSLPCLYLIHIPFCDQSFPPKWSCYPHLSITSPFYVDSKNIGRRIHCNAFPTNFFSLQAIMYGCFSTNNRHSEFNEITSTRLLSETSTPSIPKYD